MAKSGKRKRKKKKVSVAPIKVTQNIESFNLRTQAETDANKWLLMANQISDRADDLLIDVRGWISAH